MDSCFTRDPSTGKNQFYGEYLMNAQGEDVVAGVRTPRPINIAQKKEGDEESLEEFMPEGVRWITPKGGLYVWTATPDSIATRADGDVFKKAVEKGVLYVPGEFCYYPEAGREKPHNWMRRSFGVETPENVREGIRRLASAIKDALAREA